MTALPAQWLDRERRRLRVDQSAVGDTVYSVLTAACALVVPALVVAIAVAIFAAAWPAFSKLGLSIVTSSNWDVAGGHFGAFSRTSRIGLDSVVPKCTRPGASSCVRL